MATAKELSMEELVKRTLAEQHAKIEMLEHLAQELEKHRPVPVSERLPEKNTTVWVKADFDGKEFWTHEGEEAEWMPE